MRMTPPITPGLYTLHCHDGMSQKHENMRNHSRAVKRLTAFELALAELRKTLSEHHHNSDES